MQPIQIHENKELFRVPIYENYYKSLWVQTYNDKLPHYIVKDQDGRTNIQTESQFMIDVVYYLEHFIKIDKENLPSAYETNPEIKEIHDTITKWNIEFLEKCKEYMNSQVEIHETNPTWMITLESVVDDGEE